MTNASIMPEGLPPSAHDRFAARLRGGGPVGIAAIFVVFAGLSVTPPIGAVLVMLWLWLSRTPLRDVGLVRPNSWVGGLVIGGLLGVTFKVAMKAVVMPLLGVAPINAAYQYLANDPVAAVNFAAFVVYGAGFSEELYFRGYLFERFGRLWGTSVLATSATLTTTTMVFAVRHYVEQGFPGVLNALFTGFAFGILFVVNRRRLWTVVVAHAAFDLTAIAMIYYNFEDRVSHLVFKHP